jgi:hypothetical protein
MSGVCPVQRMRLDAMRRCSFRPAPIPWTVGSWIALTGKENNSIPPAGGFEHRSAAGAEVTLGPCDVVSARAGFAEPL